MLTSATYSVQFLDTAQVSGLNNSSENHVAAVKFFNQAKRRGSWRRLKARLAGRSVQLEHYPTTWRPSEGLAPGGVQAIALDQITGSEGRSQDFDHEFWPITEHTRDRWVSIARVVGAGKTLPPVQLTRSASGYVVRDGHHRISVARAFGQEVIEAEVI
jgi:hypothetical protein